MEWIAIITGVILYAFLAYVTYYNEVRTSIWYLPLFSVFSLLTGLVFAITAKYLDDKSRMYMFSFYWDTLLTLTYFVVPIVFFGVQFTRTATCGMILVIIGLIILKISGD